MGNKTSSDKIENLGPIIDSQQKIETHYTIMSNDTILFKFNHSPEKYAKCSLSIEKLKSVLKIENPNEIMGLSFKVDKILDLIKDDNNKNALSDISKNLKKKINDFFTLFKNMYNSTKDTCTSCIVYLKDYVNMKRTDTQELVYMQNRVRDNVTELQNSYNSYSKFNDEITLLNNMLSLINIDFNNKGFKDYQLLKNYYEEHENDIKNHYEIEKFDDFKRLLNTLLGLYTYFKSKLDILDKFRTSVNDISNLFVSTLDSLGIGKNNTDIMNELSEYFRLMIKHRYIRHIEIKIGEIEKINNESNEGENNQLLINLQSYNNNNNS